MPETGHEVRLRVLTPADAAWLEGLDQAAGEFAHPLGWHADKLATELEEGRYACADKVGWAVLVDGRPAGAAVARDLSSGEGVLDVRLETGVRGRGVGREVLRQLADHHFADHLGLRRLEGRTHEHNVPMQRAFNAAGFRMEARYRDAFEHVDGTLAAEWGYALTRADWERGRHRADDGGYDLHGLVFVLDTDAGEPATMTRGSIAKFLQEGRRVLVRYDGGDVTDGEAAGILLDDALRYRYVHRFREHHLVTGSGIARVQRRGDDRLEVIDEWRSDRGRGGRHVWVERR